MAASSTSSVWKIDAALGHNYYYYYYDPLLKVNRGSINFSLPSLNGAVKLAIPPPSLASRSSFHSTFWRNKAYRLAIITNASAEKSSEIHIHHIHQSYRVLDIITFIWRLPGFFTRLFKKEEKILDEVEEDIIKAADVIKGGAKVVEEVAEGLEEVAEVIEKVAETVDKDAQKVEKVMDKVKEKTRIAHDELEEVVGSLQGSMEVVEKDVTKVQIKVKETKEESASLPNTQENPPSKIEFGDEVIKNRPYTMDYRPLQDVKHVWRSYSFYDGLQDTLKWLVLSICIRHRSLTSRPTLLLATLLIVYFSLGLGVTTSIPLVI